MKTEERIKTLTEFFFVLMHVALHIDKLIVETEDNIAAEYKTLEVYRDMLKEGLEDFDKLISEMKAKNEENKKNPKDLFQSLAFSMFDKDTAKQFVDVLKEAQEESKDENNTQSE